jgi:succinyl-diaminopimelate desuccinylase
MDKYFEYIQAPDFGFAPDSDFPVIYAEKGILIFEIAKKLEKNHEPGLCLRSIDGGAAPNMVPDKCRTILVYEDSTSGGKPAGARGKGKKTKISEKGSGKEAELRNKAYEHVKEAAKAFNDSSKTITCKGAGNALEITSKGFSAHGSTPEKGLNAISVMMEFLSRLPLVNESARDFVDFYHTSIGYETDGKGLGIAMEDGISGSLIVNTGVLEMNREAAVLTVNVRYPISKNENDIYSVLMPVLDENGLGVVKQSVLPPLYHQPDEPLIKTLIDVYRENTGDEEGKPIVTGGGTYARSIPNAAAFGPRFPDEEDVMHQKDEYISIDSFMKAAHIYADAIYRLSL